jgi:hypothetical protein
MPRFKETESIVWKNYCWPISDRNLYFQAKLFEANVTTRYVKWWKQSVLGHGNLVKNIAKRRRSESSCKQSQANISGNDVDVPLGFPSKV